MQSLQEDEESSAGAAQIIAQIVLPRYQKPGTNLPSFLLSAARSLFQQDSSFLYMGRLLEGFGVGIISYTVPVYIAEIAPQNMRGGLGSVNQLSVTIGIMLAYVLGLFVQWRILAVLGDYFFWSDRCCCDEDWKAN